MVACAKLLAELSGVISPYKDTKMALYSALNEKITILEILPTMQLLQHSNVGSPAAHKALVATGI